MGNLSRYNRNSNKQNNKQITNKQQQYKNIKNDKNVVVVKDNETTTAEKAIPIREEIANYCQAANISIDIDDFISYNEVQGWKVKDWKAAVRRWKKNESRFAEKKKQGQQSETKSGKYDFDALQKKAFDNISNKNQSEVVNVE